ncbi:MAG: TrkH family potassium uptake protein [Desulfovibrio sp.]
MRQRLVLPFLLPILFFGVFILVGAVLLTLPVASAGAQVGWVDALFTATSAMCVTGLAVLDTGTAFTRFGQSVILVLIQLGGLGIMTYTSLLIYLLGRKVSLTDRIAMEQSLVRDSSFQLGRFLITVVCGALFIELIGAVLLYLQDPVHFGPYSAMFHAVSAFCNAGFSLFPDSLSRFQFDWGMNIVFAILITLGGLGFYVISELVIVARSRLKKQTVHKPFLFSWHTRVVLETTLFITIVGTVLLFLAELAGGQEYGSWQDTLLVSFFQTVTCRTAGFNSVDIGGMTNLALVFMLPIMFVGGSPGSCAGGVKTTTLRVWWGFVVSCIKGREQTVVGRYALSRQGLNKAFTLITFAVLLVSLATAILNVTEGGDVPHTMARGRFLEILFEVISAFTTTGLSMGLTPELSILGKIQVIILMFIGRLGPVWLISLLQIWQGTPRYKVPEDELPVG